MLLAWKDQFSVDDGGVIDRDHKALVVRINDLLRKLAGGPQACDVLKDLFGLRLHAEHHFAREERIQAAAGYPGLAEHAAEHRDLLARIDVALDELEAAPPRAVIPDYKAKRALLYRWVIHHLVDTDQKMKPFLARQGGAHEDRATAREANAAV